MAAAKKKGISKKAAEMAAETTFTSMRILGKKAQNLMKKAADLKRQSEESVEPSDIARELKEADVTIRLSPLSVAQATLVIIAIVLGAWMTAALKDTIILMLMALFLAAVIDPGVHSLEKMGFPRGIAILLLYFIAIFVFLFLLVSIIPIIAEQVQEIAFLINDIVNRFLANPRISLPLLTDDVNMRLTDFIRSSLEGMSIVRFTDALQLVGQSMSSIAQGSFAAITRFAGSVGNFFVKLIIVLVLAFFIQVEKEHIRLWVRSFFTAKHRAYLDIKTEAIHQKIGQWARGQMLLGLCIGALVFLALTILGLPYAATLAVLAAFTEFIPYIGPFIAAVPSILIALTEGGFLYAVIVAGVYYIIQWCENNLLVPLIMKRAVGLSPIAIIFAMLMGLSFPDIIHPILGLLIAVPLTTIIAVFLEDWKVIKKSSR